MFHQHWPHHIRFIDAPPEGGANTPADPEQNVQDEPEGADVDWQAKYREAIAHSRDWEKKAKANKSAADELEQLKASQMSEAEKTAQHMQELEAKVAAYEAEKQQAEWKRDVAAKTGIPAEALKGSTLEEIQAHAETLKQIFKPAPKLPNVPDPAKHPEGKTADERAKAYVRSLFGEAD
ncbi:helicase [Bifidobacterium biavatii]|uniref:helicase n=1 Tax=Bifidobacterium biavatii TaxID=762212 RepID=UPI000529B588|nr:helicase [Bifidobacterium biavatii]